MRENVKKIIIIIVAIAGLSFSNILLQLTSQPQIEKLFTKGRFHIYFLNVGQGDATLIRTPSGKNILIDAGPDLSILSEVGRALPFYERVIDLAIITHFDQDHILGFIPLSQRYQIRQVWKSRWTVENDLWRILVGNLKRQGTKINQVKTGDTLLIDGVRLEILYPEKQVASNDSNSWSLVIKARLGDGVSLLFSGDLPQAQETMLVKQGAPLQANILQVGHHGSRTSSNLDWLQAVSPDLAVISVGKDNKFGHPHFRTLRNLDLLNIKVLRTDKIGTIHLVSDGRIIWQE